MKSLLYITSIAFLTLFCGCKKDSLSKVIVGTWQKRVASSTNESVDQYTFNKDGTFEKLAFIASVDTHQILGYNSKSTGRYKLSGTDLELTNISSYYNSNYSSTLYVDLNQLILKTDISSYAIYSARFNDDYSVLTLDAPCPAYANCVGAQAYQRQ